MASIAGTKPKKSRSKLLVMALPFLLLLAVLVNIENIKKIASGEKSLRSIVYGINMTEGEGMMGWQVPDDMGAEDAKVTIEAFLMGGESCHTSTALRAITLGRIDPERIRVKFVDVRGNPEARERRDAVKLGCDQGFAINGKTEFQVPDTTSGNGKKRTVFLAHSHETGSVNLQDVIYPVLDQELKAAYNGKGLEMTAEEFIARIEASSGLAQTILQASAEANAQKQQAKTGQ